MKKTHIALAVAAASVAAGASYAQDMPMYVNHDKTGEYLIYPFYTADTGNETYITVTNTTAQAKAVKVRILEAENSWEVRDFNVYLSPFDHFSFAISLDESGAGRLDTGDNSCTVPSLTDGVAFTNVLFDAVDGEGNSVEANPSLERTINGHVEIIEMGQFGRLTDAGWVESTDDGATANLWLHDANTGEGESGVWEPNNCAGVEALWTQGINGAASGAWYVEGPPGSGDNGVTGEGTMWRGGGLYGTGMVVNPDQGWAIGYDAIAVDDFVVAGYSSSADGVGSGAHLHFYPGDTDPGLGTARDGINDSAIIFANYGEAGTGLLEVATSINALTMAALFQSESIANDYVLDPFFDGSTDWIITFPTKHFHVNNDPVIQPFTNEWDGNESCDDYTIQTWDREERTFVPEGDLIRPPFSPYTPDNPTPQDIEICYETNVLTFGTQDAETGEGVFDSVFWGLEPSASSSRIHTPIGTAYANGWAALDWADEDHAIDVEDVGSILGLPAVGFAAIQFENGTIDGGILANYAGAHEHKFQKQLSLIDG